MKKRKEASHVFEKLTVWQDANTREQLRWYLLVATNKRPAKYKISRKIKVNIQKKELKNASTNDLWRIHDQAQENFWKTWRRIKQDKAYYDMLENPEVSLLDLNVELTQRMLSSCDFCEWHCHVDRRNKEAGKKQGVCMLGEESRVALVFLHHGEELVFRGINGSGTIFFSSCNMKCVFCQNANISKDKDQGQVVTPRQLAFMFEDLTRAGAHNINLVGGDPTPHLHTIMKALQILAQQARQTHNKNNTVIMVNTPFLWNSNFYMSTNAMKLLNTVIDVWLPDFKFWNNTCARRLAKTPRYWETITRNLSVLREHEESFVIRHLIMPNHLECCSKPILEWLKQEIPHALINLMGQYHPDYKTNQRSPVYSQKYQDINRRVTREEIQEALEYAEALNLNYKTVTYY